MKLKKYLERQHRAELKYDKDAKLYETLEDYLEDNGYTEVCDELLPEIRCLREEDSYYFGIDPCTMDDNETMGQFKARVQKKAKELLGKEVKCNFISREYSC